MANRYEGVIRVTGDSNTLELMYVLCQRLDACAAVSQFDADTDWIGHIFSSEPLKRGVFMDSIQMVKGMLTLHIHAVHSPGEDLLLQVACSLGVNLAYQYTDEDGDTYYRKYTPNMACDAPHVSLRTEESLDTEIEEEESGETPTTPVESIGHREENYGYSSGLSSMNLFCHRETDASADNALGITRDGAAFYARYKELITLLTRCGQSFDELPTIRDVVCYMTQNLVNDLVAWCENSGKSGSMPYDHWAILISNSASLRRAVEFTPNRIPHYTEVSWSLISSGLESAAAIARRVFPSVASEFASTRVPNCFW